MLAGIRSPKPNLFVKKNTLVGHRRPVPNGNVAFASSSQHTVIRSAIVMIISCFPVRDGQASHEPANRGLRRKQQQQFGTSSNLVLSRRRHRRLGPIRFSTYQSLQLRYRSSFVQCNKDVQLVQFTARARCCHALTYSSTHYIYWSPCKMSLTNCN